MDKYDLLLMLADIRTLIRACGKKRRDTLKRLTDATLKLLWEDYIAHDLSDDIKDDLMEEFKYRGYGNMT